MKSGRASYDVVESLPKWTILVFYTKSIFVGLWILMKWIVFLLWNSLRQTRHTNPSLSSSSGGGNGSQMELDYDGNPHGKPPDILIDNSIGKHSYIKLKSVKLHYVEAGASKSPLLLLLHGFPDCWLGWRNQIKELSRYFRVIALDMKGFNDSDKPMWRQEYTPKKICEEIRQFIYSLGSSRATIIGHDIGAVIGWFFAHTNPDHIDRFICVSTPHPNLIWSHLNPKAVLNNSWLQFIQLPLAAEWDHSSRHSLFLEKCLRATGRIENNPKTGGVMSLTKYSSIRGGAAGVGSSSSLDINSSEYSNFNIIDTYKYIFNRRTDWTGPLNYYRNFPFYRIKEGNVIRCPILIVTGSDDNFCRLDSMVKSAEYCETSVVKIIDGSGHWPHQENPEQFNKHIIKFLVGNRIQHQESPNIEKNTKGIMGRMFGAVTNSVKIGTSVIDSVQQRTNNVLNSALY